jgi:hypothetical protein
MQYMIFTIHLRWLAPSTTRTLVKLLLLFIFSSTAAQSGLLPPRPRGFLITHNDAQQTVGLLWTSDRLVAENSTWQHTQKTNIHAHGRIRTHDCSRRADVVLRLRPRGHWDRQRTDYSYKLRKKLASFGLYYSSISWCTVQRMWSSELYLYPHIRLIAR